MKKYLALGFFVAFVVLLANKIYVPYFYSRMDLVKTQGEGCGSAAVFKSGDKRLVVIKSGQRGWLVLFRQNGSLPQVLNRMEFQIQRRFIVLKRDFENGVPLNDGVKIPDGSVEIKGKVSRFRLDKTCEYEIESQEI